MTICIYIDASLGSVSMALLSERKKMGGGGAAPDSSVLDESAASVKQPCWEILQAQFYTDARRGTALLADLLTSSLKHAGLVREDVAGCVVGTGPGSFTGIKVAMSFAYGLSAATAGRIWVRGVNALECAAGSLRGDDGAQPTALFLPATRAQGYFSLAAGGLTSTRVVDLEHPRELERLATELLGTDAFLADSWPQFEEAVAACEGSPHVLRRASPQRLAVAALEGAARIGVAAAAGDLASSRITVGAAVSHPAGEPLHHVLPRPNYMRLSRAEERLLQAKQEDQNI